MKRLELVPSERNDLTTRQLLIRHSCENCSLHQLWTCSNTIKTMLYCLGFRIVCLLRQPSPKSFLLLGFLPSWTRVTGRVVQVYLGGVTSASARILFGEVRRSRPSKTIHSSPTSTHEVQQLAQTRHAEDERISLSLSGAHTHTP